MEWEGVEECILLKYIITLLCHPPNKDMSLFLVKLGYIKAVWIIFDNLFPTFSSVFEKIRVFFQTDNMCWTP